MATGKALHSRKFFLANLVLVGIIVGFALSTVVFSCSTSERIQPGKTAYAQEPRTTEVDASALEGSFREVADAIIPSVVKVSVAADDGEGQPDDFPGLTTFLENRTMINPADRGDWGRV